MSADFINVTSISQIHDALGLPKPKHPLITLVDVADTFITEETLNAKIVYDFFIISLKDKNCGVEYGRNTLDFDEGVMSFSSPGQVYKPTRIYDKGEINGWMLFFHPDLIKKTHLSSEIDEYSFFTYEVYEALHLSEDEENLMNICAQNIKTEYEQRIDNHSQRVLVSNIELMLNYCLRFYERQFNTRTSQSKDVVSVFEKELKKYFKQKIKEEGFPSIQYFADISQLSKHYFSDLIKKETNRSPKDHINDYAIKMAKNMLLSTNHTINEIAYDLGFNYPHYFTRMFKTKTGKTPVEYRSLN